MNQDSYQSTQDYFNGQRYVSCYIEGCIHCRTVNDDYYYVCSHGHWVVCGDYETAELVLSQTRNKE